MLKHSFCSSLALLCFSDLCRVVENGPCSMGRWASPLWSDCLGLRPPTPWGHVVGNGVPNSWNPSAVPCSQTLTTCSMAAMLGVGWAEGCLLVPLFLCSHSNGDWQTSVSSPILGLVAKCACHSGKTYFCRRAKIWTHDYMNPKCEYVITRSHRHLLLVHQQSPEWGCNGFPK